jgi:potassium voltage-gated channel Eag-related subfamily H protein 7
MNEKSMRGQRHKNSTLMGQQIPARHPTNKHTADVRRKFSQIEERPEAWHSQSKPMPPSDAHTPTVPYGNVAGKPPPKLAHGQSRKASVLNLLIDMEHESKITAAKSESAVHSTDKDPFLFCIIIDPRQTTTLRWDALVMVLLIYTAYITPYEVAFLETRINVMFAINRFVDLVFLIDLFKNFVTAYFDDYEQYWVGDHRKIAMNYLRGWFMIDFVSILPFDTVGLALQSSSVTNQRNAGNKMDSSQAIRLIRVMRLLKMMRLIRSVRILSRWQDQLGVTYVFRMAMKLVIGICTCIHWQACLLRLIVEFYPYTTHSCTGDGTDVVCASTPVSWLEDGWLVQQKMSEAGPSRQYIVALTWSTQTLATTGYGTVSPTTEVETVMMVVCMFLSSMLFTYSMAETQHLVANSEAMGREHNQQADNLNWFCMQNEVPQHMAVRLREFFRHSKAIHRSRFFKEIMTAMSPTLRGEVSAFLNETLTKNCWFLSADGVEERRKFLTQMTLQLCTAVYGSQELILKEGDRMQGVQLVRKGIAFGGKGQFGKVYTVGRWFGVEGLLVERRYRYEIRSLNFMICEIFTKEALDKILWTGDFPNTYRKLRRAVVRLVFREDVCRAAEVIEGKRQAAKEQGNTQKKFTVEENTYVKYGTFNPPMEADVEQAVLLGQGTPSELFQHIVSVEKRMLKKVEGFTKEYVESKERIALALQMHTNTNTRAAA